VVFSAWWMFITILTSFYTANLTAFLTLSRFTLPINVPQDIIAKRHPFIGLRGSAVEYSIKNVSEVLKFKFNFHQFLNEFNFKLLLNSHKRHDIKNFHLPHASNCNQQS
jgi:hypothetical protein